jgi:hypothetical protein
LKNIGPILFKEHFNASGGSVFNASDWYCSDCDQDEVTINQGVIQINIDGVEAKV